MIPKHRRLWLQHYDWLLEAERVTVESDQVAISIWIARAGTAWRSAFFATRTRASKDTPRVVVGECPGSDFATRDAALDGAVLRASRLLGIQPPAMDFT